LTISLEHLAAHMTTFLEGRELVLVVDPGDAGLDHRLGELEEIEHPPESRLAVGDNGRVPVRHDVGPTFRMGDLVGAGKGVIEATDQLGNAVRWVERLVGVGLGGLIHVARHLPARNIDRLETGLHHLHRLVAGQRPDSAEACQGAFLDDGASKPDHIRRRVGALDTLPSRIVLPTVLEMIDGLLIIPACRTRALHL
jgi:hypothetical protein